MFKPGDLIIFKPTGTIRQVKEILACGTKIQATNQKIYSINQCELWEPQILAEQ